MDTWTSWATLRSMVKYAVIGIAINAIFALYLTSALNPAYTALEMSLLLSTPSIAVAALGAGDRSLLPTIARFKVGAALYLMAYIGWVLLLIIIRAVFQSSPFGW